VHLRGAVGFEHAQSYAVGLAAALHTQAVRDVDEPERGGDPARRPQTGRTVDVRGRSWRRTGSVVEPGGAAGRAQRAGLGFQLGQ
jgi:hypothetical protein